MTIIEVKKLTEDEAKKQLTKFIDLDDYLDECKTCGVLGLRHRGNKYIQDNHAELEVECRIWHQYRVKIKTIVVYIMRMRVVEKIAEKEQGQWTKGLQSLMETMEKKCSDKHKSCPGATPLTMARVVKLAEVPLQKKSMSLDTYTKQLNIWQTSNADVLESTQFQDFMESLKMNKEINDYRDL